MSDARAEFRASGYAATNEPAVDEWANEVPAPAEGPQAPGVPAEQLRVALDESLNAHSYGVASSGYQEWVAAGRPWAPAQPIAELTKVLRDHGYTVYILGDTSHQLANPPEDHVPYSATGWPVPSPRWFVHALDIMPPTNGAPDLGRLAQQLVADKDAGVASWIKYLNVSLPGQPCQHISWEPSKAVTGSSDVGHIHLSIRSDATHWSTNGYDPIARIHAPAPAPAPAPKPAAPAFPMAYPPNYFGDIDGPWNSHGGATPAERVQVVKIQNRLNELGFHCGIADGIFGPKTIAATRAFQSARHLFVDGEVGPATWGALFS